MKLKIVELLKQNKNWESVLSDLKINVVTKDDLILLKYNIAADFSNEVVRECRGIILNSNFDPVCVPFFKFGNYCEPYADEIDWTSARVQEKCDGSLIKVFYYNNEWRVATNGTIDAEDAPLGEDVSAKEIKNFKNLFFLACENVGLEIEKLNKNYTYMFELTSPYNKVVVPHIETTIVFLGARNIDTLKEESLEIGVRKPKEYKLQSLDDCVNATQALPFTEEGYVVVDKNWHRIKIKSPAYLRAHVLSTNKCVTQRRIIELLRAGDEEEFLLYFPEYSSYFVDADKNIQKVLAVMNEEKEYASSLQGTRKDFALAIKDKHFTDYLFFWKYKNPGITPEEYIEMLSTQHLLQAMERIGINVGY